MTPQQSHRRAEIMLKHGLPGWRIKNKRLDATIPWFYTSDPVWRWDLCDYVAVRVEKTTIRTPLPIEHYKRGMEVKLHNLQEGLVLANTPQTIAVWDANLAIGARYNPSSVTEWRWPNESEWKPAFTETVEEKEVERLEVEG